MSKDTIHVFNNLNVKGVIANGEIGTAGQVLHSNGTATYWAIDDNAGGTVTSVATANGLSGGPITTTGTINVVTGSTLTVNVAGIHVNTANLSIATSQLTGDVALGTDTSGNYVATITAGNGISGSSSTEGGAATIGVVTGSTLTVNTTGLHVNSALSITDLVLSGNLIVSGTRTYINTTTLEVGDNIVTLNADLGANPPTENAGIEVMRGTSANVQFIWDETNDRWSTNSQPLAISSLVAAGAASGITTLAAGNTTITGFANVTTSIRGGSSLTIAGAASGITTLAAGNTTITGFANVSTTLQVGTNTATFGTAAYIVANGNVGIGTSTPQQQLAIGSGTDQVGLGQTGTNTTISFGTPSNGTGGIRRITYNRSTGDTLFIGGSVASPATHLTLNTAGAATFSNAVSGITTLAAGNTTITGFASATTEMRAPIFKDSDNTAFFFDGASTTNINTLSGNGKTVLETTDSYLRINQSASFTNGIWTGSSNFLNSGGIFGWGSNGGTTNSRVYINGGTYNGTNVINLDGSTSVGFAAGSWRAPIFYDSDNTAYYTDPAGTSKFATVEIQTPPSAGSYLNIGGNNNYGGTGYNGFLTIYNSYGTASNPYQYWRLNSAGGWEIVNSAYNAVLFTFTQGGDFTAAGNITAYSDRKIKDNFEPIADALSKVLQLNGMTFTRIDKEDTTKRYGGLVAQDVKAVLPEAVDINETMSYGEVMSVDYNATIALLVEAIKEQQAHINKLETKINSFEQRLI